MFFRLHGLFTIGNIIKIEIRLLNFSFRKFDSRKNSLNDFLQTPDTNFLSGGFLNALMLYNPANKSNLAF